MALLESRKLGGSAGRIKRVSSPPRSQLVPTDFQRFQLVGKSPNVARFIFDPPKIGSIRYIENITWQDGEAVANFAYIYMLLTETTASATPTGQPENIIWIESVATVVGVPLGYSVNFPTPLLWEPPSSLVFGNFSSSAAGQKTATIQLTESPTS